MCELLPISYRMLQTKDQNLFFDDIRKCSVFAIWPRPWIFFVAVVLLSDTLPRCTLADCAREQGSNCRFWGSDIWSSVKSIYIGFKLKKMKNHIMMIVTLSEKIIFWRRLCFQKSTQFFLFLSLPLIILSCITYISFCQCSGARQCMWRWECPISEILQSHKLKSEPEVTSHTCSLHHRQITSSSSHHILVTSHTCASHHRHISSSLSHQA